MYYTAHDTELGYQLETAVNGRRKNPYICKSIQTNNYRLFFLNFRTVHYANGTCIRMRKNSQHRANEGLKTLTCIRLVSHGRHRRINHIQLAKQTYAKVLFKDQCHDYITTSVLWINKTDICQGENNFLIYFVICMNIYLINLIFVKLECRKCFNEYFQLIFNKISNAILLLLTSLVCLSLRFSLTQRYESSSDKAFVECKQALNIVLWYIKGKIQKDFKPNLLSILFRRDVNQTF